MYHDSSILLCVYKTFLYIVILRNYCYVFPILICYNSTILQYTIRRANSGIIQDNLFMKFECIILYFVKRKSHKLEISRTPFILCTWFKLINWKMYNKLLFSGYTCAVCRWCDNTNTVVLFAHQSAYLIKEYYYSWAGIFMNIKNIILC